MPVSGFLAGVRVLDLASVGPAARASRWLADYGAEVIKVGPVPARSGVQITPPHYAYGGHRGMQRALFDLKSDGGREAFLALAATADVVIESFRPGAVDRLGIGDAHVRATNPGVVYCSTSGYGQDGPRSQWAGHDLNYLAVAGYLDCTGPAADGGPPIPGATIADSAGGGMQAVMSILAALVRRSTTGEGAYLDVSVADGVLGIMSLFVDEHLATGVIPGPRHNVLTGRSACYDLYECADGRWLSVAAIEPHFWANLCRAIGCEQWIEHQHDDAVQDQARADLRAAFKQRDRDDWVTELGPADCCVAPVLSVPEVVADAQYAARAAFLDAHHPTAGDFRVTGPTFAGQEHPVPDADAGGRVPVPDWTQSQTADLLRAAGLPDDEIDALATAGAIA
jgi:alpha-methylacyl-CoA racemase